MDQVKIAAVVPSRGLVSARMMQNLLRELRGRDYTLFLTHDLPIPANFETPTAQVLRDKSFTHVWYVEEDVIPPQGCLAQMLDTDKRFIAVRYPLKVGGRLSEGFYSRGGSDPCHVRTWVGTGCALVKTSLLAEIAPPRFPKGNLTVVHTGSAMANPEPQFITDPRRAYGGQDIGFCWKVRCCEADLHVIDAVARHERFPENRYAPLSAPSRRVKRLPLVRLHQNLQKAS